MVEVLSQLNPIMEQLAGVNLQTFLKGISRLPGAVADQVAGKSDPVGRDDQGVPEKPATTKTDDMLDPLDGERG